MRAGASALSLFSDPLDVRILEALRAGPCSLAHLRRAVGSPPQTTMRKHLRALTDLGVLLRIQEPQFPSPVSHELSPSGRELLDIADALSAWLAVAPEGPLRFGAPAAKSAIKALIDGWTTKMMRALAARPLSLTDLDRLLPHVNYPALERRLAAMRSAGQIAPVHSRGAGTPYRVTEWLRTAVRPLAAAASWEHRHAPDDSDPLHRIDIEAMLLLVVPLLDLPSGLDGSCRLTAEIPDGAGQVRAEVVVAINDGRSVARRFDCGRPASSSVAGPAVAWLRFLASEESPDLKVGGRREVGISVVTGLRWLLASSEDVVQLA